MPTLNLAAYVGLLVVGLLGLCVTALVLMRDKAHEPWHVATHLVWCPRYERRARVEFTERVQTGMATRRVLHCSLRHEGERCGDGCAFEPVDTLRLEPAHRADRRA